MKTQVLHAIQENLITLHGADNHGEFDNYLAPYWGTISWEPIMAALRSIGYRGNLTIKIQKFMNGLHAREHR